MLALVVGCQNSDPPRAPTLEEAILSYPPLEGEKVAVTVKNRSKVGISIKAFAWGCGHDVGVEKSIAVNPGKDLTFMPFARARAFLAVTDVNCRRIVEKSPPYTLPNYVLQVCISTGNEGGKVIWGDRVNYENLEVGLSKPVVVMITDKVVTSNLNGRTTTVEILK